MLKLTQAAINKAEIRDKLYKLSDPETQGLNVHILPSGKKTFKYRFQTGGKDRSVTLGDAKSLPLTQARKLAVEYRQRKAEEAAQLADPEKNQTMSDLIDQYRTFTIVRNDKPSTIEWRDSMIRRFIIPEFGSDLVTSVTKKRVRTLLERVLVENGESTSNAVKTVLSCVLDRAVQEDTIDFNPALVLKPLASSGNKRERALAQDEIVRLFELMYGDEISTNKATVDIVTICLLTGCRRREAIEMTWREVDLKKRLWVIPKERTKGNREHLIYVTDAFMEILESQRGRKSGAVFNVALHTPRQFLSRLSNPNNPIQRRFFNKSFSLHDMRRTMSTMMTKELKISRDVVRRCLNHAPRGNDPIEHYDTYDYYDEKKAAWEAWSEWLRNKAIGKLTFPKSH